MDMLSTLGRRVHALRFDLAITQTQLAERVGTSREHITNIERDRVPNVSGTVLLRIAQALGTTTDYLLCAVDDPLPAPEMQPDEVPEHIRPIIQLIEALPPQLREDAAEYLREQLKVWQDHVVRARRGASHAPTEYVTP